MFLLGAADKPDRRHAESVLIECRLARLGQFIAIRQPEIIVRTKIQDLRAANRNFSGLFGGDDALEFIQSGVFQPNNLRTQMVNERGHRVFLLMFEGVYRLTFALAAFIKRPQSDLQIGACCRDVTEFIRSVNEHFVPH